jgi:hypothetical protein
MATRRPLVFVSGALSELPKNDVVAGALVTLTANPSGLILVGSELGSDGVALVSGAAAQNTANAALSSSAVALASGNAALSSAATAQASGNAALTSAATAQASGNAALTGLNSRVSKAGDIVSGTLVVTSQSYGTVTTFVGSGVINLNLRTTNNHEITLQGNSTLAAPVGPSGGQSGSILVRQDNTGSRLLSYSGGWAFAGGTAPTLTTTASGVDLLVYYVNNPSQFTVSTVLNVRNA